MRLLRTWIGIIGDIITGRSKETTHVELCRTRGNPAVSAVETEVMSGNELVSLHRTSASNRQIQTVAVRTTQYTIMYAQYMIF